MTDHLYFMRILTILIGFLFLAACGGGGGGGGGSTTSNLSFTTSGSGSTTSANFAAGNSQTDFFNDLNPGTLTYSYNSNGITISSTTGGLYGENLSAMTVSTASASTETTGWDSTDYSVTYTSGTRSGDLVISIPTDYSQLFGVVWAIESPIIDYYVVTHSAVGNYGNTPYASLPSSGSATYTGEMRGLYLTSSLSGSTDAVHYLTGPVSISANWVNKTLNASVTPVIGSTTYGTLTGTNISIDSNSGFSGGLSGGGFTGDIVGAFAGDSYTEVGGVLAITEGFVSYNGGNAQFMAKR